MHLIVRAGFDVVFIGIESPHEQSLAACSKFQNRNLDLFASVRKIQKAGLEVQGGCIVGFDNDRLTIFDTIFPGNIFQGFALVSVQNRIDAKGPETHNCHTGFPTY